MIDLDAMKVVLQRAGGGLECSQSLVDEARGQLKLVEEKLTSTNNAMDVMQTLFFKNKFSFGDCMTDIENDVCRILGLSSSICDCNIGTCDGSHPSYSCKVYIAREIIKLVEEKLTSDNCGCAVPALVTPKLLSCCLKTRDLCKEWDWGWKYCPVCGRQLGNSA